MASVTAFLLLGSNLGDRVHNLGAAEKNIAKLIGRVFSKSSLYETAAWGNEDQPAFLNQALNVITTLQPIELLRTVKKIEYAMGRKQSVKWGERLIDIDILLMGDTVLDSKELVVPHPQLHKRRFTLVPLAEIAGDIKHPLLNLSVRELLEKCNDPLKVEKFIPQRAPIKH